MYKINSTPLSAIILAIVLALVSGLLASTVLLDPSHAALVRIVVLLVTLWTNEGLPLGVSSLYCH